MLQLNTAAAAAAAAATDVHAALCLLATNTIAGLAIRQHDLVQHTDSSEDGSDNDEAVEDRAGSHARAAAGPSSSAAAAAAGAKQSSGKKRPAGVAFKDAVSLLPADLDEAMIKRTLRQLQPRNRMQKQALLQAYRAQFSHWRLLLRCV
jgi:hypothetical protein